MTIGLYKPGQGYWVRVLTATLIAVLTLAAAGWAFTQMKLVASKLPQSVWVMRFASPPPTPFTDGQPVTLTGKAPVDGSAVEANGDIGTGTVETFVVRAQELRVKDIQMKGVAADPSLATGVKASGGVALPLSGPPTGESAVDPLLLEGLVTAIVLLIGAMAAYYFTAIHQRFVDFLIATDGEMKKVNWSTARDIRMSTLVVVFAAFVLSASLFIVDFSFQWFFTKIGILVH